MCKRNGIYHYHYDKHGDYDNYYKVGLLLLLPSSKL